MGQDQIHELLGRISSGDKTCYRALCRLLAKEMLFVPVMYSSADDDGLTKMRVFAQALDGRTKVAIFTSEAELNEWKEKQAVQCECMPLLGVDVGTAVGEEAWLVVNPCRPYQIEISPSWVRFLAMSETKPPLAAPVKEPEAPKVTQVLQSTESFESPSLSTELTTLSRDQHNPIKRKRLLLVQEHLREGERPEKLQQRSAVGDAVSYVSEPLPPPPSSAILFPHASMRYRRSRRKQLLEFLKSIW